MTGLYVEDNRAIVFKQLSFLGGEGLKLFHMTLELKLGWIQNFVQVLEPSEDGALPMRGTQPLSCYKLEQRLKAGDRGSRDPGRTAVRMNQFWRSAVQEFPALTTQYCSLQNVLRVYFRLSVLTTKKRDTRTLWEVLDRSIFLMVVMVSRVLHISKFIK